MKQNYGQIKDNKGNTIAASRDMRMLYDAGWRIFNIKRMGMVKQVLWYDLKDTAKGAEVVSQGQAVLIQKSREKK